MQTYHLYRLVFSELSAHRLVMENIDGELTACMCLRNQPNVPIDRWTEFVSHKRSLCKLTVENTLFVHLLLWDKRYKWDWLMCMLRTMYLSVFGLQYVVICVYPGSESIEGFMTELVGKFVHQICSRAGFSGHRVFVAMREHVSSVIKVRRAV